MTRVLRPALAGLLAVGLLAGCGGYARDEPPAPYPTPTLAGQGATIAPGGETPAGSPTGEPAATPSVSASPTPAPTASGSGGQVCTQIAGTNTLTIQVAPAIRNGVDTWRVQLLQGRLSRQVIFASAPRTKGVTLRQNRYVLGLGGDGRAAALRAAWAPRAKATLIVEGRSTSETVRFRRTQTFSWSLSYPNGKQCDKKPFLSFGTAVTEKDRSGLS